MFMTRLLISIFALFCSPVGALAEGSEDAPKPARLTLDLRGDWDSTSYNEAARAAGQRDLGQMVLSTAQLNWQGSIDSDLSYRVRLRLNNESSTRGPDGLSSRVDYAFLSQKFSGWRLTLGKQSTEVGGFETDGAGEDMYFRSDANIAVNGEWRDPRREIVFSPPLKSQTGARVAVERENWSLAAIITNHPEAETAANPQPQTRLFSGLIGRWKPDSEWSFVASRHGFDASSERATRTSSTRLETYALGLQWKSGERFFQGDIVEVFGGPHLSAQLGEELSGRLRSLVMILGRRQSVWHTYLKLEKSATTWSTPSSSDLRETDGIGLIAEYHVRPKRLRYQAALTQRQWSAPGAKATAEMHAMIGFTMHAPLMGH